jgi:hypothetical protein
VVRARHKEHIVADSLHTENFARELRRLSQLLPQLLYSSFPCFDIGIRLEQFAEIAGERHGTHVTLESMDINEFSASIFKLLVNATNFANALPSHDDLEFLRVLEPKVGSQLDTVGASVDVIANDLLKFCNPNFEYNREIAERFSEFMDTTDYLFELAVGIIN